MAPLRKFMFDVDFSPSAEADDSGDGNAFEEAFCSNGKTAEPSFEADGETSPESAEEEVLAPSFTEEELAAAKESAFEAGRAEGAANVLSEHDHLLSQILAQCAGGLSALAQHQKEDEEKALAESLQIFQVILAKIFPETCAAHGLDEVIGVVRECLSGIDRPIRVSVRVHPDMVPLLQEKAQMITTETGFEGKIIIVGDPRIMSGDCRVEWGDGGAERNQNGILADINAALTKALSNMRMNNTPKIDPQ